MPSAFLKSCLWFLFVALIPQANNKAPNESDVRIRLERTSCFGRCPVYSVTLFSDGRVVYEGKLNVAVIGLRTKRIPAARVLQIARQVQSIDYFSFDHRINLAFDVPTAITDIHIGDRHNRVEHF